jgi:hypothetical protein
MTNTNWRSLVAVPLMALGCCCVAAASVAMPRPAPTALGQGGLAGPATGSVHVGALSCYGTLEGYLKCDDKKDPPTAPVPPPKKLS